MAEQLDASPCGRRMTISIAGGAGGLWLLGLAALVLLAVLGACGRQEPPAIRVQDIHLRLLPTGGMGAVYFTLVNEGRPDRLVAVLAEPPALAGVHESRREKGMARMIVRKSVSVPAHDRLRFAPGGLHVMLSRIPQPPPAACRLTLRFDRHPDIMVTAPLSPSGGGGGDGR